VAALKNRIADFLLKIFASDSPLRKRFSDPGPIIQGTGVKPGQTLLEVGCGRGFFTLLIAETIGPEGHLYALDVTEASVDYVARKVEAAGLSNVDVIKANALDSGLPDAGIDLALLFGVIPSPTLPYSRLIPEMHRVLKPGGRLAVWTAVPGWSPQSITQTGVFDYIGKENNCHTFVVVKK
jgi:ubiquinone/menaquinone biosynthesis C-methylase UbiE